ncbi:MAG: anthranilate synthase component I family protein [Ferruginibacter sp.]|nr:anthranilate synthase component I family protein [Cytophagales bacterium]
MKTYPLRTTHKKLLADTLTPVSIYLKLRDKFVNSILLESSDYHGNENSFSYLCCQPIGKFVLTPRGVTQQFPDGSETQVPLTDKGQVLAQLRQFSGRFVAEPSPFRFISNGLFGYVAYDAVQFFEDLTPTADRPFDIDIPLIHYQVFRYVIAINHFKNELHIFEHRWEDQSTAAASAEEGGIAYLESLIRNKNFPLYAFHPEEAEASNFTDREFLDVLAHGQSHCQRGDVFQIVLSRRFSKRFRGDEFNVYRALRSVNPSPYLFYFDFGSYKIFGSSPEAQIVIKGSTASIYPIAGTFRRTGDDQADAELARRLYDDPKENAEHVMLVDLARNDLSRHSDHVEVKTFKEIQYYSHVIHLVSHVQGQINGGTSALQMVADTFPAGTLSGAPKHMAMQLIDRYENVSRGYYGGCIGFMDFNGDFNHAIMIRSFLSKDSVLHYQAGAGVVAKSSAESELQEVNNKLAALRRAIELAKEI